MSQISDSDDVVRSDKEEPEVRKALENWRAARQDIFDNTTNISEENRERWLHLSIAEHALMKIACDISRETP